MVVSSFVQLVTTFHLANRLFRLGCRVLDYCPEGLSHTFTNVGLVILDQWDYVMSMAGVAWLVLVSVFKTEEACWEIRLVGSTPIVCRHFYWHLFVNCRKFAKDPSVCHGDYTNVEQNAHVYMTSLWESLRRFIQHIRFRILSMWTQNFWKNGTNTSNVLKKYMSIYLYSR